MSEVVTGEEKSEDDSSTVGVGIWKTKLPSLHPLSFHFITELITFIEYADADSGNIKMKAPTPGYG